jgi:hypothetical protein
MSDEDAALSPGKFSSAMYALLERRVPPEQTRLQGECAQSLRECGVAIRQSVPERESVNGGMAVVAEANHLADLLDEGITIFVLSEPTAPEINFGLGHLVEVERLQALLEQCSMLKSAIAELPARGQTHTSAIERFYAYVRSWSVDVLDPALSDVATMQLQPTVYRMVLENTVQQELNARQSRSINQLQQSAQQTLEYMRRASGQVATATIAGTFKTSAREEQIRTRLWTTGTFLAAGVGVSLSIWAFTRGANFAHYEGWPAFAAKVLIGLPFYAAAAYCARIAAGHRDLYRHLFILVAQLDSVYAYTEDLPTDQQRDLNMLLGQRAFGNPQATTDTSVFSVLPTDLVSAAARIIEVAEKSAGRK